MKVKDITLDYITFPVFKLRGYDKLITIDGITTLSTYWQKEYILDNKNLVGETLGARRARIKEGKIYPLKVMYKTPRDLVVNASTGDVFIDNTGRLFNYRKTKNCKITCYKIKNKINHNGKCIINLETFPVPFVVPTKHVLGINYVTVVKYGEYYMLYSLEKQKVPDTKKRL